MKLFAAACLASAFADSNMANKMDRFRREAGYDTISFIDSESDPNHTQWPYGFCAIMGIISNKLLEETRAWGAQVAEETYEKKGEIITVDDLDMYVVGDGPNGKTLWNFAIVYSSYGVNHITWNNWLGTRLKC